MKNNILIIALILLNGLYYSCVEDFKLGNKFLEKAPGVDVTKDTIFAKSEYAQRFLWNTYGYLYYGVPQ